MTPAETFGTRLRRAREAGGLSQEQVATLAGVSLSTVRNWETGRSAPNRIERVGLAAELEAPWLTDPIHVNGEELR